MTTPLRVIALQNAKAAVKMAHRRLKAFERMVAEHDPLRGDSDMATAGMINQFAASLTQPTALPPAPPAPLLPSLISFFVPFFASIPLPPQVSRVHFARFLCTRAESNSNKKKKSTN